jgi:ABC-2 type transport system ATP-binding protein
LDRVGLSHAAGKKVKAYSLGMKQRLGIANALLSPRDLLILDEPTNGLDPQGTREVRSLVRSLAAGGTTVFVSSHLLAEVEQICSHAAVMSAGRLVAQGTLAELRRAGRVQLKVTTPDVGDARRVLGGLGLEAIVGPPDGADGYLTAAFPVDALKPEDIAAALVRDGIRLRGFTVEGSSLEERYVALTGEGFEVEH